MQLQQDSCVAESKLSRIASMLVGESLAAATLAANPLFSLLFHLVSAVWDKLDVRAKHRITLSDITCLKKWPNLDYDGVAGVLAAIGGQDAETLEAGWTKN